MKAGLFILLIFISGCSAKTGSPADILPEQQMEKVVWDVMQADEFVNQYLARDSSKNSKIERMKLYQQIFKLHHVSEKQFSSSFKYYSSRPDILKVMFDSLGARADRERQNVFKKTH